MQTNHQKPKTKKTDCRESLKEQRVRTPRKARHLIRRNLDDLEGLASLFTLNEYGCRVIGGRRIC